MNTKTAKNASLPEEPSRDLDPNVMQKKASEPVSSVWVNASAGTGKTKVLADRVLRLLLPREDGSPGTPIHKILCLTFTKAAASEMALRINKILSCWAVAPLERGPGTPPEAKTLREELKALLGREAQEAEITAARQLFAKVIDAPGGLNIMTLHAFCQSVLGRFPLEAGLMPGFTVAEEREAQNLLRTACARVLAEAARNKASPLHEALKNIAGTLHQTTFMPLVLTLMKERRQLENLLQKYFGSEGLYTQICTRLGIRPGETAEDILEAACKDNALDIDGLRHFTRTLKDSKLKTDRQAGQRMEAWLNADVNTRQTCFSDYKALFLTKGGQIRKKAAGKAVCEDHPEVSDIFEREALRLLDVQERLNKTSNALLTYHLFLFGQVILEEYTKIKTDRLVLDFDDLIFKTLDLLGQEADERGKTNAQWVHYKLDHGLEHILVDEAQDTNPEQWKIIEALCSEFFAGDSAQDQTRTIFVVGDEKQSIYSFQRASPEEFARMRNHFSAKILSARAQWQSVDLNISFRSAKSILEAVDSVFQNPAVRKGLGLHDIKHFSYRHGQAGRVELWPLFEDDKPEQADPWTLPTSAREHTSGTVKLAGHIARTIQSWLTSGEELSSRGRAVRPGDIMVLVRTRTAFTQQLTRALKACTIPVGGLDRVVLNNQIAVQDILACMEFALLPGDDLTLACLLKSPLIGMEEDTLYTLAYGRAGSLWDQVRERAKPEISSYLSNLIREAHHATPHDFISALLQRPCPANALSGLRAIQRRLGADSVDALDELLSAALEFEHDNIPVLQGFLQWQKHDATDIKRSQEEQADHVRIMTVHGSKGLQAPIVILPDTTRLPGNAGPQAGNRLLWPDKTGLDIPLWSPRKDCEYDLYKKASSALHERNDEEYRRLLYVAMTRAEDRLYIGGVQNRTDLPDGCWYSLIRAGLERHTEAQRTENGGIRLTNPQIHTPDKPAVKKETERKTGVPPSWLYEEPPYEPHPPKPLSPSRPTQEEPPVLSPLQSAKDNRFRRGNLIHKLLEILPDIPLEKRQKTAEYFTSRYAADLEAACRAEIIKTVQTLLEHKEFAPLFSPGSLAEVPITGLLPDGQRISGRIDRLLIEKDDIWIVDYKTNRLPPKSPQDIPALYRQQLENYGAILKGIYPHRTVHAALLWTDGPVLMPLDINSI